MTDTTQPILAEAHSALAELYGDRLVRVILYGSQARGDATPESDIDVLVVLCGDFDLYAETKRLVQLSIGLFDRYGQDVSFQPFTEASYQNPDSSFMRNVQREGILL